MSHSDVTVQYQAGYFIGSGSIPDKLTVRSNEVTITLTDQVVRYRLTLSGADGGWVYPYTGDGWHEENTEVTIRATAHYKDGFKFIGWHTPEGTSEGLGEPDVKVTMSENKSFHATFELLPPKESEEENDD